MSKKFHLSCLVTSSHLGEDESKIPDSTGLVKKTVYNAEISDIEEEYFTSPDYNKFTNEITETETKEKTIVDNSCTSNLIKIFDSNTKLATSATKVELKTIKDKILKLLAFGLSYLSGKSRYI